MFENANPATAEHYEAAMGAQAAAAQSGRPDAESAPVSAPTAILGQLSGATARPGQPHDIDLVLDIPVQLTVELGRARIPIRSVLELAQGSVVELDGLAGEPLDVLVNGCLIAQGEVVVVNDKFGIRLTDIVTPSERFRKTSR